MRLKLLLCPSLPSAPIQCAPPNTPPRAVGSPVGCAPSASSCRPPTPCKQAAPPQLYQKNKPRKRGPRVGGCVCISPAAFYPTAASPRGGKCFGRGGGRDELPPTPTAEPMEVAAPKIHLGAVIWGGGRPQAQPDPTHSTPVCCRLVSRRGAGAGGLTGFGLEGAGDAGAVGTHPRGCPKASGGAPDMFMGAQRHLGVPACFWGCVFFFCPSG